MEITLRIIIEKGEHIQTIPVNEPLIQYNPIQIKRIYHKKWDPEYQRKPIKKALKSSKLSRIVKQEPLLDSHLEYLTQF